MNRRFIWLFLGAMILFAGVLIALLRDETRTTPQAGAVATAQGHTSDASASSVTSAGGVATGTDEAPAAVVQTPMIIDPETDKPLIEPLPLQKGELAWEARIRSVLSREKLSESEKARALLELLPTIPAEGAETCAEEAVKRLPNADYRFAQNVVINPGTYGLALGVLFADLMDRPDELRLPTLITIARNSTHPYAANARENLELLIGKDYGTDWTQWDSAIREKLGRR